MSKFYTYKDIGFPVADEEDVLFTVEFISDGNSGPTVINTPAPGEITIIDSGSKLIGKGKDLRSPQTTVTSALYNPIPHEDEIRVRYKINGIVIKEHLNLKTEDERPIIILFINFPKK